MEPVEIDTLFDPRVLALKQDTMDRIKAIAELEQKLLTNDNIVKGLVLAKDRLEYRMILDIGNAVHPQTQKQLYPNDNMRRAAFEEMKSTEAAHGYVDGYTKKTYIQVMDELAAYTDEVTNLQIQRDLQVRMYQLDQNLLSLVSRSFNKV